MNTQDPSTLNTALIASSTLAGHADELEMIHPANLLHTRDDESDAEWDDDDGDSYVSGLQCVVGVQSLARWNDKGNTDPIRVCRPFELRPVDTIRKLLVGRLYQLPFPGLDDCPLPVFPVMSLEEALLIVGVVEPSVRQLDIARQTLLELVGNPRVVFGRERWLVVPREDDSLLEKELSETFPIDQTMVFPVQNYLQKRPKLAERLLRLVKR